MLGRIKNNTVDQDDSPVSGITARDSLFDSLESVKTLAATVDGAVADEVLVRV